VIQQRKPLRLCDRTGSTEVQEGTRPGRVLETSNIVSYLLLSFTRVLLLLVRCTRDTAKKAQSLTPPKCSLRPNRFNSWFCKILIDHPTRLFVDVQITNVFSTDVCTHFEEAEWTRRIRALQRSFTEEAVPVIENMRYWHWLWLLVAIAKRMWGSQKGRSALHGPHSLTHWYRVRSARTIPLQSTGTRADHLS
jgi:hypothetical protein